MTIFLFYLQVPTFMFIKVYKERNKRPSRLFLSIDFLTLEANLLRMSNFLAYCALQQEEYSALKAESLFISACAYSSSQ